MAGMCRDRLSVRDVDCIVRVLLAAAAAFFQFGGHCSSCSPLEVSSAPPRRRTKPGPKGPGFIFPFGPKGPGFIWGPFYFAPKLDRSPRQFGSRPLALITAMAAGLRR